MDYQDRCEPEVNLELRLELPSLHLYPWLPYLKHSSRTILTYHDIFRTGSLIRGKAIPSAKDNLLSALLHDLTNRQFPHLLTPPKEQRDAQIDQPMLQILQQLRTRLHELFWRPTEETLPGFGRPDEFAAGYAASFVDHGAHLKGVN